MFWIYMLVGTAGVVTLVPSVLRALDGLPSDVVVGTIGFAGTVFALTGFVLGQFSLRSVTVLVAAVMFGMAAGAIHPEVLSALRGDKNSLEPTSETDANV